MSLSIQQVRTRRELNRFIDFPVWLYADNPCYVPHLKSERKQFFDARRNPLFRSVTATYFLAHDPVKGIVGRMTAHIHSRHNEFWNENVGFFGFFECIEDFNVAKALLDAGEAWLRERGIDKIRGPFNFSTNEECGFLAQGFDRMPALMMPYSPPYYLDFMADAGYSPVKDLIAYELNSEGIEPAFLKRSSRRVGQRNDVTVRQLDLKRFDEEVAKAFAVYNSSWEKNWGFIPVSEAEFHFTARNLKPILDPAITLLAEREGEVIGFFLAVPDYNPILKRLNGRLWPWGPWHFLRNRRRISKARVMAMGVLEDQRKRGVETQLLHAAFEHGLPKGYHSCEMSWILEENELMKRLIERIGGEETKRYRIVEKPLCKSS